MLKKNQDKRYLRIMEHYGPNHQQKKLAEEHFELQEAITIVEQREQDYLEEYHKCLLVDEIADNLVLLMEYIQYYDIDIDRVNERVEYKLDRQNRRIENE